jgi:Na+/H+-dicarboxylate symporter
VIGAIPSGGMTAEVLICTLFGVPVEYVGIILVISIIIDIPATLLNSTGNNVCAMLITRMVEGKNWILKKGI